MKNTLLCLLISLQFIACTSKTDKLDLSGEWSVQLDSTDVGISEGWQGEIFGQTIVLPGTTDDAGMGTPNTLEAALTKPQLTALTRNNSYLGAAWYNREITVPEDWSGKELILNLERVIWDTQVWVDGVQAEGQEESLTTPHIYNLTSLIKPGQKQTLSIRVDNRERHDIAVQDLTHAYGNHTQITWNGIIGNISIEALDKVYIENVQLYPDMATKSVMARIVVANATGGEQLASLNLVVKSKNGTATFKPIDKEFVASKGESTVEITYNMGDTFVAWSEFTPEIYQAVATVTAGDMTSTTATDFGMRQIENRGNQMFINDNPLFLRGTLECCIFPLTGTPPMDKAGWEKVFGAAKAYGLNHLRFHSWCPPKAAFEVADEMGFYLQVELPVWVLTIGQDDATVEFLRTEADRIIAAYGNHPSFVMWSLGNELQGDFGVLEAMMKELKAKDARHLYTTTSFTFEKGHGAWPEPEDQFFITQWTDKGWVRGQGVFNQKSPSFDKDYVAQIAGWDVPLITHEIGQYSVYPDLTEIAKYTGVLTPLNFMAVENDLKAKGLLDKAPDYLKASGELAAILYKEEIERALKTAGISGFQLLDLHDFPGQGTALVGLLNAFWESKGIITGEEFREFCSPVVPLLKFAKAAYKNNETFTAEIELCNYGAEVMKDKTISWQVLNGDAVVASGSDKVAEAVYGYNGALGTVSTSLAGITEATQLDVVVSVDNTEYINRWKIWVYPTEPTIEWGNVKYTRNYNEATDLLAKGETVLFNPDWHTIKGIEGKFVPVFWSPVHFPSQAGTMGILCDPSHKALADFPTEMHTDWQWWDLTINSTTLITDTLQGGAPIVEMVDNFANNRRLASLYEGTVGNGKLIMATFDLKNDLDKRPVANQMLYSILNYMNSDNFAPAALANFGDIKEMFSAANNTKEDATSIY